MPGKGNLADAVAKIGSGEVLDVEALAGPPEMNVEKGLAQPFVEVPWRGLLGRDDGEAEGVMLGDVGFQAQAPHVGVDRV